MSKLLLASLSLAFLVNVADAEIDGYGPDAWRVTDVEPGDRLNARMGPGTEYRVIDSFAYDERGLEQITCVPFTAMGYYFSLSETEQEDLPPRWCLMRSTDLSRAGWVAQRYITADYADDVRNGAPASSQNLSSEEMIMRAQTLVSSLYKAAQLAELGGPHPLTPDNAGNYFSADIVEILKTKPLRADPLFDAQNFEGSVSGPTPAPDQPMLRGMITVNVDIVNFDQRKTVVFRLRADTSQPDAPIRIFRIEHEEWSFPELPSE
ncbi:hypothetical protein K1X12_14720 [Hyphomonas sp. WL0036]|uniref:hypothetical protein n=1 Tax=Hyphomonas sediminis TaxID=2866160 RepID=UPI001C7F49C4|nr:hypothetical protein [Hyphomonas sediminis]MBY9068162.1 hypothetical protein [Hyphomonas sediminis]